MTLRAANEFANVTQFSGLLKMASSSAGLGSGHYDMFGGEFLATADVTLSNDFGIGGDVVVAAAAGKTLSVDSTWSFADPSALTFGDAGATGIVSWGGATVAGNAPSTVHVAAGTLRGGDGGNGALSELLFNANGTTVEFGATIDAGDVGVYIYQLEGGGTITGSGFSTVDIIFGSFSGHIEGDVSLYVDGTLSLTGNSTYSAGTHIGPGATLFLGNGGTGGSIPNSIVNEGTLVVNHSNTITLNPVVGNDGIVILEGTGTTIINNANFYHERTDIYAGVASLGNGGGFGFGLVRMFGGEILATATETILNDITVAGHDNIAAGHGTTLTIDDAWTLHSGSAMTFGAPGQNGTVVAALGGGLTITGSYSLDIANGTLKGVDVNFSNLTNFARTTTVEAGAKLDLAGVNVTVGDLLGAGTATNSGASANLTLNGGDFSGVIAGPLTLTVHGPTVLSGNNTYAGGTIIDITGALALGSGGNKGSVQGPIDDDGVLIFNHANALTVASVISGNGNVEQVGTGVTTLTKANSYTAQTFVLGGTLASSHAGAFGTGHIHVRAGELLISTTQAIANQVAVNGTGVIAAAHGTTATFTGGFLVNNDAVGTTLAFGAVGANGTVVLKPVGVGVAPGYTVDVADGTLKAGNEVQRRDGKRRRQHRRGGRDDRHQRSRNRASQS